MLTKNAFEAAARIAREASTEDRPAVVRAFLKLFAEAGPNPRFDVERFTAACEPRTAAAPAPKRKRRTA